MAGGYIFIGPPRGSRRAPSADHRVAAAAAGPAQEDAMEVVLTQEEADLLEGTLEKVLGEIREEIFHADVSSYKEDLKREEALLKAIIAKLP